MTFTSITSAIWNVEIECCVINRQLIVGGKKGKDETHKKFTRKERTSYSHIDWSILYGLNLTTPIIQPILFVTSIVNGPKKLTNHI